MKKIIKYIFTGKKKTSSSINGYSSFMSLLCFAMLIQIVSLVVSYSHEQSYLLYAFRQSNLDLTVMDAAKTIVEHNQFIRRCHQNQEDLILHKKVMANEKEIIFEDNETCLHAYTESLHYIFYYDDHSIVSMDIAKE